MQSPPPPFFSRGGGGGWDGAGVYSFLLIQRIIPDA